MAQKPQCHPSLMPPITEERNARAAERSGRAAGLKDPEVQEELEAEAAAEAEAVEETEAASDAEEQSEAEVEAEE